MRFPPATKELTILALAVAAGIAAAANAYGAIVVIGSIILLLGLWKYKGVTRFLLILGSLAMFFGVMQYDPIIIVGSILVFVFPALLPVWGRKA